MDEIGREAQKLNILLKPMVAMIVKELRPKSDDISLNKSYKIYGRCWIDQQRRAGNVTERNVSNRTYLSISEIEALRAAEASTPRILAKWDGKHGYESFRNGDKIVIRRIEESPEKKKRGRKSKISFNV